MILANKLLWPRQLLIVGDGFHDEKPSAEALAFRSLMQAARGIGRLYDHTCVGQSSHHPISFRKVGRENALADGERREQKMITIDRFLKFGIFSGVRFVKRCSDDGGRTAMVFNGA